MTPQEIIDIFFDEHGKLNFPCVELDIADLMSDGIIDGSYCNIADTPEIWVYTDNIYAFGSVKDHIFHMYDGSDKPRMLIDFIGYEGPLFINFAPSRIGPSEIIIECDSIMINHLDIEITWNEKWDQKFDLLGKDFCQNDTDKIAFMALSRNPCNPYDLIEFLRI